MRETFAPVRPSVRYCIPPERTVAASALPAIIETAAPIRAAIARNCRLVTCTPLPSAPQDSPQSRRLRKQPTVSAACNFDKSAQLGAQLADCETHVLVRNPIELGRRLLVQRLRSLKVAALRVQNRDRSLDQSLVVKFHLTVGPLPDFLPRFVTLKEAPLVE